MANKIWITWENQRRSQELSKILGCKLFVICSDGIFRYLMNINKTIYVLFNEKPEILFVQNPSIILATLSSLLKNLFGYKLIIDRHSNFLLTPVRRNFLYVYIFNILSIFTIRNACLTIVTNKELYHFIKIIGGNPFILPDKIPSLIPSKSKQITYGQKNILCISSFADDEPLNELLEASRILPSSEYKILISGDYSKLESKYLEDLPDNVVLTGYLSNEDYIDLLFQVDAVVVLTKIEYTVLCGCYEAISAEKPLITSNTNSLKNIFTESFFVDNNPESISNGIKFVLDNLNEFRLKSISMKNKIEKSWNKKFENLKEIVY